MRSSNTLAAELEPNNGAEFSLDFDLLARLAIEPVGELAVCVGVAGLDQVEELVGKGIKPMLPIAVNATSQRTLERIRPRLFV